MHKKYMPESMEVIRPVAPGSRLIPRDKQIGVTGLTDREVAKQLKKH